MTVSIIIAVKDNNKHLRECIESCLKLEYPDFEILVFPDESISLPYPEVRIIPTGKRTAPQKRDMAIDNARGEILAFIDDDAYPSSHWLLSATKLFEDKEIAAVGGPAVTPSSDSLKQKASGLVYCLPLVSGPYVYRYLPKKSRFVDDYPSCNFLIRKRIFQEVSGFNTKFWPGEDTFLCLKIVRDLHKKIFYDPGVLVYHHRRSLFSGHGIQIANYALHRGYFVKRYPANSLKFTYFLPSLWLLAILIGFAFSLVLPAFWAVYISGLFLYLTIVLIFIIFNELALQGAKGFRLTFLVFGGTIYTHIVYGLYFVKGLLSQKLKEE